MYYKEFGLAILRGAKVQWCWTLEVVKWNRRFSACDGITFTWLEPVYEEVWGLRLLYYRVKLLAQVKSQVEQLKIFGYWSGFVSFMRGLHFRFCKRWRNYSG